MTTGITLEFPIHICTSRRGERKLRAGVEPPTPTVVPERTPRISRLMALALRFDDLIRRGEVGDFAEIASLSHVTRARISQIVNLLNLAPDIQEEILFLAPVKGDKDAVAERQVRAIALETNWKKQRVLWRELLLARPVHPVG